MILSLSSPSGAPSAGRVRKDVPPLYLEEALQAFRSNCTLATTVMLGVATEHAFLLLIKAIQKNPVHRRTFSSIKKEWGPLRQASAFCKILDREKHKLPENIREDLSVYLACILALIGNFRNKLDRPSGKIIDRKQSYLLLQVYPQCCHKMGQLMEYYG